VGPMSLARWSNLTSQQIASGVALAHTDQTGLDTLVAINRTHQAAPECAAHGLYDEMLGCKMSCRCAWYQTCYPKHALDPVWGVQNVGVCDLSMFAIAAMSAASFVVIAKVVFFARAILEVLSQLLEERAQLKFREADSQLLAQQARTTLSAAARERTAS